MDSKTIELQRTETDSIRSRIYIMVSSVDTRIASIVVQSSSSLLNFFTEATVPKATLYAVLTVGSYGCLLVVAWCRLMAREVSHERHTVVTFLLALHQLTI